ncbi:hypothetical protein [Embleya sp. NPDC059237]|uniref:hypothetical protein n=1 Tax=Embleya sp. NPDC059237 TaxID=3346784 RepID=UPI003689602B
MYLLHARLRVPNGCELPPEASRFVLSSALPEDGLEHVSVHAHAPGGPVLGLFLIAPDLGVAEAAGRRVCERALAADGPLAGFVLAGVAAGLVPQAFDRWLS